MGAEAGAVPVEFLVHQVAHHYGIAPWELERDDPAVRAWFNRGAYFLAAEAGARNVRAGKVE